MARRARTFESMLPDVQRRIEENPAKALREIGKIMSADVRNAAPKRTGRLKRSIGYWYRNRQKDLQVGSKIFYAAPVERRHVQFILNTFRARQAWIQDTIMANLRRLGR